VLAQDTSSHAAASNDSPDLSSKNTTYSYI
jgi:hypothetical protein